MLFIKVYNNLLQYQRESLVEEMCDLEGSPKNESKCVILSLGVHIQFIEAKKFTSTIRVLK